MLPDTDNPTFQLALQFVNQTRQSIFLTGKAGTGKTTFLRYIKEHSFKKMAVTAPTGVAAINAGGTTLHSFFQLPFGPFVPTPQFGWNTDTTGFSDPNSLLRNSKLSAPKKDLLRELELLVIDEVSMVRADMLDAVDLLLRHFRQQPDTAFGGVQVLLIGDLFQLPPVVSNTEWELLKEYYPSPFFFDAQVIRRSPPVCLELKKIYRQNEARFIRILNNIRNNQSTPEDLETLHDYYQPDFIPPSNQQYITITSHNARADNLNREELGKLRGKEYTFEATVTGEFGEKAYPAEKALTLREGAQIMMIKNDKGENRRYYNGKIGTIQRITPEKITITFDDDPEELNLEKEVWKNIRYNYDREKDKIEEEELGSFTQYPVRLAWAITIHKSQGLTFERAVIDAGASFAPGQVYVALSRLTSIEGLVLKSRILPHAISTDPRVIGFTESRMEEGAIERHLEQEQIYFIGESLLKAFRWTKLTETLQRNFTDLVQKALPDKINALELSRQWLDKAIAQQQVADRFCRQLDQMLPAAEGDGYQQLHQRTRAAADYFIKALEDELIAPLLQHISEMRARQKAKKYTQGLQALRGLLLRKKQEITEALQVVSGLAQGMDASRLLDTVQEARKQQAPASEKDNEQASGKSQKGDSHRASLQLYKEGVSITEIATLRGLNATTIESHLASFIPTGEIEVTELVPEHKLKKIIAAIKELGGTALGPLKSRLGEDYTFGEIRAALTHHRHIST